MPVRRGGMAYLSRTQRIICPASLEAFAIRGVEVEDVADHMRYCPLAGHRVILGSTVKRDKGMKNISKRLKIKILIVYLQPAKVYRGV